MLPPLLALALAAGSAAGEPPHGSAASKGAPVDAVKDTFKDTVDFGRDVRPLLAEHCYACHGPDEAARKGDLRLDLGDEARAAGIFDEDPAEFMRRIDGAEDWELMPPPEVENPLDQAAVETLRRWVAAGAPYEAHWAFEAPKAEAAPAPEAPWGRNPIDRFVLAGLTEAGLEPSPEADRRTLARRLSLDLTGLPPDPAEVEAFVLDESPDAYEQLVDRWMGRDTWGEHRARQWLDVARYADTHGIHFDNYRDIWPYRDWVIDAFNGDMPFDQFSIEQLAGDLLPDATLEQRVATGFLRCNITTNEGGLIDEEYKVLYARDRTETFGQAWLGMSVGCAVCHDHKYDPLSQREFYELSAFFDNTTVPVRDGNVKDPKPILRVTPEGERDRRAQLLASLEVGRRKRGERANAARADLGAWLAETGGAGIGAVAPDRSYEALHLPLSEGAGEYVTAIVDGAAAAYPLEGKAAWSPEGPSGVALKTEGQSVTIPRAADFERDEPFTSTAWVKVRKGEPTGALWSRMDSPSAFRGWDVWLQNGRVGTHIIHAFPEDWLKVVARDPLPVDRWVHVAVTYDGSSKAAGVAIYHDGVLQPTRTEADKLTGSTRTEVPFRVGTRSGGSPTRARLSELRVHRGVLNSAQIQGLALSRLAATAARAGYDALDADGQASLNRWWLENRDLEWQGLDAIVKTEETALAAIENASPTAHVFGERDGAPMAYVLNRGEYDQRGEQVGAGTPAFLPPLPEGAKRDRLALARWLFQPGHPLTARVAVNRYWQEVFGQGIVPTSGDFGLAGEHPTHPELLDWLALHFEAEGWSVKRLFRTLVTSATYRQSARMTPERLERDPDNALLSRGPRFRMDAEMVRDTALAASGLLVPTIGGPSVKPYQPPGVWEAVAMRESNTHSYVQDQGDGLRRRSMYTFWKRSAPPASMEIFDAPSRETCAVRRERTNTPLQALVTLNDPQFIEAARALAERALALEAPAAGTVDDGARMDHIMARLTSRALADDERAVCAGVLADLRTHYAGDPDAAAALLNVGDSTSAEDPAELAAWTMLANMLMNLDEVVNK